MHKRSCPMHSGTHTQPTREKTCNLEVQQYMYVYLLYYQAHLQEVLSKYLQCVYCAQLLAWPAWEPSVLSPSTNALSPPSGYLWLYMWSYELKRQNQSGCMHALIHIQATVPAHNLARRDTYRRAHWGHRYVIRCLVAGRRKSDPSNRPQLDQYARLSYTQLEELYSAVQKDTVSSPGGTTGCSIALTIPGDFPAAVRGLGLGGSSFFTLQRRLRWKFLKQLIRDMTIAPWIKPRTGGDTSILVRNSCREIMRKKLCHIMQCK